MKKLVSLPIGNSLKCALGGILALALPAISSAANVTLTGIDGFGASSFNTAGLWDSGLAPSAGNDYFVPDATRLRTPADGGSYVFAGDSLTINNTTPYGDGFMYKGTGSSGSITVDNLIMDGGLISHANGTGDIFNLYGGMLVTANGARLYAKQGPVNIYSAISGSGTIDVLTPDADGACKLWLYSSLNTFTGNIVNNGRLGLVDGANLNFVIGPSGVNTDFTLGASVKHTTFDGIFDFDLSGATMTLGDSWQVVPPTGSTPTYYGGTFTVDGFTDIGSGQWSKPTGGGDLYLFDQATGVLSVVLVPEPSTGALFLGGLALLLGYQRSRKS